MSNSGDGECRAPVAAPNRPIRTCVGCRRARPQDELVRLYVNAEDRLCLGRSGPGRGAWLCADEAASCFATAVDRKALARAFRRAIDAKSVAEFARRWQG